LGPKKNLVSYDYRHTDGELFSCVKPTLEQCRANRDKWLKGKTKKAQHTPGPWRYDGENGTFSVFSDDENECGDIAQVNPYHEKPDKTAEANADLISKAWLIPEMLEALTHAMHELDDLGKRKTFKSRWPEINSTSNLLFYTIEKATE
jgi:hypothetical protein